MLAVHNTAVRRVGLGPLTDNLYRLYIPLQQLATASFLVRPPVVETTMVVNGLV